MSLLKKASPDHPIHELFVKRWSPYAFSDQAVPEEDLRALFEAARWSASNFNEQPWRYIVATRKDPEEFERLLSCLIWMSSISRGPKPLRCLLWAARP